MQKNNFCIISNKSLKACEAGNAPSYFVIFKKKEKEENQINKKLEESPKEIKEEPISEIQCSENEENLDNYELNNLEYNKALKLDKRNFIEIYFSFLKRQHPIIFTFFAKNDHNIVLIKFSRFIFSICTDIDYLFHFFDIFFFFS